MAAFISYATTQGLPLTEAQRVANSAVILAQYLAYVAATGLVDLTPYAIASDGSTDNAAGLMQMRADLAANPTKAVRIKVPSGAGLKTANNRWIYALRNAVVDFNKVPLTIDYDGTDDIPQRALYNGELTQNNVLTYGGGKEYTTNDRVQTVLAGATKLYLLEPAKAANTDKYRVGGRLKIYSGELDPQGYPSGCRNVQLLTITAIDTSNGGISFTPPLLATHSEEEPDFSYSSGGGSGKPRIESLDRQGASEGGGFVYADSIEIQNLIDTNLKPGWHGGILLAGATVVWRNCTSNGGIQPSQNLLSVSYIDCDFDHGEIDKELGDVYLTRTRFRGQFGNGNARRLIVTDCEFVGAGFYPNVRHTEITGTLLTAGRVNGNDTHLGSLFDAPARRAMEYLRLANCRFNSTSENDAKHHIAIAVHTKWSVVAVDSTTDLLLPTLVPNDDAFTPWRQTRVGMFLSNKTGSKRGYVTAKVADGNIGMRIRGTWPKFAQGEEIVWSYVMNMVDEGGHQVLDGRRLYAPNSLRWQGNTATNGTFTTRLTQADIYVNVPTLEVDYFAFLHEVRINVTTPAAGSLKMTLNPNGVGGPRRDLLQLNLNQAGERVVRPGYVTAQNGDTIDADAIGLWIDALEFYYPQGGATFTVDIVWSHDPPA